MLYSKSLTSLYGNRVYGEKRNVNSEAYFDRRHVSAHEHIKWYYEQYAYYGINSDSQPFRHFLKDKSGKYFKEYKENSGKHSQNSCGCGAFSNCYKGADSDSVNKNRIAAQNAFFKNAFCIRF